MWVYGLDRAGPGLRLVADGCECSNEPSGSVKCGEFLDQLQTGQLLKKDFAPWSKFFFFNCVIYQILQKRVVEPHGQHMMMVYDAEQV